MDIKREGADSIADDTGAAARRGVLAEEAAS